MRGITTRWLLQDAAVGGRRGRQLPGEPPAQPTRSATAGCRSSARAPTSGWCRRSCVSCRCCGSSHGRRGAGRARGPVRAAGVRRRRRDRPDGTATRPSCSCWRTARRTSSRPASTATTRSWTCSRTATTSAARCSAAGRTRGTSPSRPSRPCTVLVLPGQSFQQMNGQSDALREHIRAGARATGAAAEQGRRGGDRAVVRARRRGRAARHVRRLRARAARVRAGRRTDAAAGAHAGSPTSTTTR